MYELLATLKGARNAVISTSFSPQARFIAAVGYGGISVWGLETYKNLPISSDNVYNHRNPDNVYTACAWLHFEQADRYVLIIGSQKGTLSTLNWDNETKSFEPSLQVPPEGSPHQVLSIDVYQAEVPLGRLARIAVATADNRATVYSLSPFGDLQEIFSSVVENFSLVAARFCKKNRDVYVFELNGGGISLLDAKTGNVKSTHKYGPDPMGTVCLDDSSKFFVACTGKDFEMFRLENIEHVQTFSGELPIVLFPKVATYAEDGSVLVVGTDRGHASIFNVSDGDKIQDLPYTTTGLVQSVAAITARDGFLVAIAGSTLHSRAEVLIFKKSHASLDKPENTATNLPSPGRSIRYYLFMAVGLYLLFHGLLSTVLVCTTWVYSMAMDRQIPEVIGHAVGSIPEQIFEAVALKYDLTTKPPSPQFTPLPKQNIKYRPTSLTIPFATSASVSLSDVVETETSTWTTITIEHRPTAQ